MTTIETNDTTTPRKTKMITDLNFKKLLDIKSAVYEAANVTPSISKIINLLIDQADLDTIQQQLIDRYR